MGQNKCKRCEYEWKPRQENVKVCPRCKSYLWNILLPHRCRICQRRFDYLATHHIDGNSKNDIPSNRLIICVDCHSVIHGGLKEGRKIRHYNTGSKVLDKLKYYHNKWKEGKKKLKTEIK